jgi:alpha-mannosidase
MELIVKTNKYRNDIGRPTMKHRLFSSLKGLAILMLLSAVSAGAAQFTPLIPIPAPHIVESASPYPDPNFYAVRLIDGDPKTEYSSDGKGTDTFVEFRFPESVNVGAFQHIDRNDPATIAASEIIFMDDAGTVVTSASVTHANRPSGQTVMMLPAPVAAQRVKWRVTQLGPQNYGTVGGAEITFFTVGTPEATPIQDTIEVKQLPILDNSNSGTVQSLRVTITHPYAEPADAFLHIDGAAPHPLRLEFGTQTEMITAPAVDAEITAAIALEVAGTRLAQSEIRRRPVKPLTVYVLPHSHTDIGYTEIQTAIEDKQVQNLLAGMEIARRTADYPEGARFIWNVEVLWAADLFLRRLGAAAQQQFFEAVKSGQVALNGMYLNELTGLCRTEELLRLFRMATQIGEQTGTPIESAMISDVPGYTWGTVSAMAHAGIRYFSVAPNYFDRIGDILVQWENKPFYWVGPDGSSRVLVWIPFWGYAMSHRYREMSPKLIEEFCDGLNQRDYPYEIAYVRWAGIGDNAVPDPSICDFIRDWNTAHVSPRFVIASTTEAFRAFEQRYGAELPSVAGDWTPYWEDGAGSSALETATNRASSDRLAQAETVWALANPQSYPADAFEDAWRNVLLYSEHTWGAWCSVSDPFRRETREQWAVKQSYAVAADLQSRDLMSRALAQIEGLPTHDAIDIVNTASWTRSELVLLPKFLSEGKDRMVDANGQPVPTQRLRNGELVMWAQDVPPLAARRYTLQAGVSHTAGAVTVEGASIDNGIIHLSVDEKTGGIVELHLSGLEANLVDSADGQALNEYLYFIGDDPSKVEGNGRVHVRTGEVGPLVASLLIESDAPGCRQLVREIRLVAGQDVVEIVNTLDKERLVAKRYHAKTAKESLNFGFPFAVPDGQMRLDVPFGVIRPDVDQIPSACKNWFTVGRWADVSNDTFGITWVTLDAPLVQVGGLSANLLNSQSNPDVWRKEVGPTQKLYAWAMNNHWGTNYRAWQEGPHVFRFLLRPHRGYDPAAAARIATAAGQPLLPVAARGAQPVTSPFTEVSTQDVMLTGLKPSDDGKALILRIWGAAGKDAQVTLAWQDTVQQNFWLSDVSERPNEKIAGPVTVPAWGVVSLRAEHGN